MTQIYAFFVSHSTTSALIAMWLFSNVVTALPSPNGSSGRGYQFFFALMHGLAGSLPRVFPKARVFNDPTQNQPTYFSTPAPVDAPK